MPKVERFRAAAGLCLILALSAFCLASPDAPGAAASEEPLTRKGPVFRVRYEGPIHPIAAEIISRMIQKAAAADAALAVIELDTPGGLMTSMQDIKKAILNSKVPVAVYVSPRGAQAASAGFFILMAADIAAMSPGSTTGAAHPVSIGGGQEKDEDSGAMGKKILQSAVSEIRAMAQARGRNPDLAVQAVMGDVKSFTAEEAVEKNLVDFIADDLDELLRKAQEMTVTRFTGGREKLDLKPLQITTLEPTLREKILGAIADPNVLFILMGLGMLGLYVEFSNPGLVFPGVLGAIFLVLALFAMQVLPINYAGVLLILLGFAFFIAEIKVVSYGLLTAGGLVSLLLGGMLLIKEPVPGMEINMSTLIGVVVIVTAAAAAVGWLVLKTYRAQVSTGSEGMLGREAEALESFEGAGKVEMDGEIWNAVSAAPVEKGQRVRVVRAEGLTLFVENVQK